MTGTYFGGRSHLGQGKLFYMGGQVQHRPPRNNQITKSCYLSFNFSTSILHLCNFMEGKVSYLEN